MIQLPKEITDIMMSDAYNNTSNPKYTTTHEQINEYFKNAYPGKTQYDATGRIIEDNEPTVTVWITGEGCEDCAGMNGAIIESGEAQCGHPNCKCYEATMTISEYYKKYKKFPKNTKKQEEEIERNKIKITEYKNTYGIDLKEEKEKRLRKNDENFEKVYTMLKEPEGGYTDGKNQVKDEPTNMGIKQSTLDNYNKDNPQLNFPKDVKDLKPEQAKEIYKKNYWDNTKIPNIKNARIRRAIFDMNVMGGASKVTRQTLNEFSYINSKLNVNGGITSDIIKIINTIPENKVTEFMDILKEKRFNYLRSSKNWPTSKGGWTTRTMAY